jgi:23S rRNA (adenine2503-C2)-methyltransferase
VKKWNFSQMAAFGDRYYQPGDRKITLNFALAHGTPLDPQVLLNYFDPQRFLVKITPLNPTHHAVKSGLTSYIDPKRISESETSATVLALRQAGYQVIVSIGEVEENAIGSNCGQYVLRHLQAQQALQDAYSYSLQEYGD